MAEECFLNTFPPFLTYINTLSVYIILLAELTRAVTYDNIVDFRLVTILGVELLLGISNKLFVKVVANQVNGATAKSTTHDSRTSNTVLLGYIV